MSRIRGISQRIQGVLLEKMIPLFAIASLDHDWYPWVKSRYLADDPALVNCNLFNLTGLLSSEETRKQALGLLRSTPLSTANLISNAQAQSPPTVLPQSHLRQPIMNPSPMDYPPPRGFPWKCIAAMVRFDTLYPGCHINKPDDPPCLKFH